MDIVKDYVEEIMAQSTAPLIVQKVQDRLAEERLKRQAFYEMIDEDMKAEFVNGEIFYHSPVVKMHTDGTVGLFALLDAYVDEHDLGFVGIEKVMITLPRNDYEPDICYFQNEKSQHFTKKTMHYPVPDFVAEVLSKSSKRMIEHDTKTKYDDYEQHGVPEYWIIDPDEETVEQFVLKEGKYELVLKAKEGIIESHAVQGFAIPIRAIFDKKEKRKALRAILNQQ
ncbi:MAG: Uma2 family endonuclease [Bacteroidota bacterium]